MLSTLVLILTLAASASAAVCQLPLSATVFLGVAWGYGCLTISGTPAAGSPVVLEYTCQNSWFAWNMGAHNTKVKWSGTDLCLSAGSNPSNGAQATLAACGSAGTDWFYTYQRLQTPDGRFCIDNRDGKLASGNPIQVWECHNGPGSPNENKDYVNQLIGVLYNVEY